MVIMKTEEETKPFQASCDMTVGSKNAVVDNYQTQPRYRNRLTEPGEPLELQLTSIGIS